MMMVVGDDRAPGLLPPRKRLLAGLKQRALHTSPSLAAAAAAPPATAMASLPPPCSSCGRPNSSLHRLPRLGSPPSFLCSSCVLSSHSHMYCFLCLQLFTPLHPSSSQCISCCQCRRLSHLQCALHSWPPSFNGENLSSALCIDCVASISSAGERLPCPMQPSSKKQRTGRDPERIGPKWAGLDLIPQASLELPLVDQEALAAAKVVAAIAEKEALDAKMRAMATAAAAAQAAARAKVALDNAYRVGQEEAMAPDKPEELVEADAISDRAAAGDLMVQHQSTGNDQSRRQKMPSSVPRNSRSAAPVYKRRTLSAIVASEASRALASAAAANRAISLAALKQQARRPRSNASKRSGGAAEAAQAKHQAEPSPNSELVAMADDSRGGGVETPCSSQSGKPQDSPSPTPVRPSNVSQVSFEANAQRWNVFEMCHPSHETRHETPSFTATATKAQDLNLSAEESPVISEADHVNKCMRNPRTVTSLASSLQEAERLSCLEASSNTQDDGRMKNTPIVGLGPHALTDVLKYPPNHLPQDRSSFRGHVLSSLSTQNSQFDDRFVKGSGFQSGHCPDTDLGRLEIVLPVVEAAEKGSRGLGSVASNYKAVAMEAYSDKATAAVMLRPTSAPGRKFRDGKCCGAMKNQRDGSLHSREANCSMITDEQGKISMSNAGMVSSCSVPLQAAAFAGFFSRSHT